MAAKTMTVYQKLILARQKFLEAGMKKSGKNMALEFKYFELSDIVPMVTSIFAELGLIALVNFTEEVASMTVVDTETEAKIEFCSPMRIPETNRGVNAMQALGAAHTYLRRYLYMMGMDICEADSIEPMLQKEVTPDTPVPAPVEKKPQIPPTTAERAEIKGEVVKADGLADDLQITAIKGALARLIELDETKVGFVDDVCRMTNQFTTLKRDAAEILILKVNEMIEEYNVGE